MSLIRLVQADVREWLPQEAQRNSYRYDCIFTDYPYWTLNRWAGIGTTARMGLGRKGSGSDKREEKFYDTISKSELEQCMYAMEKLLKPNTHLYMMCDDEVSDVIKQFFYSGNFLFNYCKRIVWDKIDRGMGYHYRSTYEYVVCLSIDEMLRELQAQQNDDLEPEQIQYVMFLEKGKKRLNDLALPDVLHHKRVQSKGHYPTEKPYGLIESFILNSTQEGDLVLDPTMGSGVVAEVCLRNNRHFVGVDKSAASLEYVSTRLAKVLAGDKELELESTIFVQDNGYL